MIEELVAAVDALVEADPHVLRDGETVLALRRQLARLDAVAARAAAAFNTTRDWAKDGARSAAGWLAWKTGERREAVEASVRLGRALCAMPLVEQAWTAGDITMNHVAALARVRKPSTEKPFTRDEAKLVDDARRLNYAQFTKTVSYWLQVNGEEEAEKRAAKQVEDRTFSASVTFGGSIDLKGLLDPINGAAFVGELRRLEQELFEADWTAAKERLGREPTAIELDRTAGQRRADALVEMAKRSASTPPGSRRPAPLFTVLVDYPTLAGRVCELANGHVVTPGALVPWLTEAYVERVVFDPASRVIDVGRSRRLFTGAARKAAKLSNDTCYHDSCDEPAEYCQADHITEWSKGGATSPDNGRPACGFHNRLRNLQFDYDDDDPP